MTGDAARAMGFLLGGAVVWTLLGTGWLAWYALAIALLNWLVADPR